MSWRHFDRSYTMSCRVQASVWLLVGGGRVQRCVIMTVWVDFSADINATPLGDD